MKRTATIVIFAIGVFAFNVGAQIQPEEDNQSWNDIQLTLPVNDYFEFNTAFTMRLGKNVTRVNDGRFAFGFTVKPTKALSIQPFYWHIRARNALSRFRTEHRLNLRFVYKFPIKSFGLSHRSWFEYRIRAPLKAWRYRPSLTFEKNFPEKWIAKSKFYVTEEIFYDSLLERFSRNRFTIGVNRTISKQVSVDLYYMRQNDGTTRPGDLNVIGTGWRVKF
jgi:hypothetical protein